MLIVISCTNLIFINVASISVPAAQYAKNLLYTKEGTLLCKSYKRRSSLKEIENIDRYGRSLTSNKIIQDNDNVKYRGLDR